MSPKGRKYQLRTTPPVTEATFGAQRARTARPRAPRCGHAAMHSGTPGTSCGARARGCLEGSWSPQRQKETPSRACAPTLTLLRRTKDAEIPPDTAGAAAAAAAAPPALDSHPRCEGRCGRMRRHRLCKMDLMEQFASSPSPRPSASATRKAPESGRCLRSPLRPTPPGGGRARLAPRGSRSRNPLPCAREGRRAAQNSSARGSSPP